MEEKLFCRHCGKQIPHDSIFCQHCGKSVDLVKENLVTCVDEVKDEKESSLKIEIVKTSDSKNEERAKKFVSRLIREVVLIALFVGIAFAGKGALYHVFVQSNQPPLVTEERQQAFKDAIFKLIQSKFNNINEENYINYLDNDEIKNEIIKDIDFYGRKNDLKGFELPKKIYLCKEPFSIENQIITPTLKIRRHQAKKFFAKEINKLYGFNNEI